MSDFLVDLGANPTARKAIKKAGLPIPLPQKLKRDKGPWGERPIADLPHIVHHGPDSELAPVLARFLGKAGANISIIGNDDMVAPYRDFGDACGRLPATDIQGDLRPHGLVFDATGLKQPADLKAVYDFFHKWVRSMRPCGRALLLSRPPESLKTAAAASAARALDGFVRSVAREIGKKGSTAQRVIVDPGAENQLESVMRFLLSSRSAYISAQTVHVTNVVPVLEEAPYKAPLEDKVALVTGAARGIGKSIAKSLAREGAHVIVMDRPAEESAVSVLANELKGTMLLLDITDPEAVAKTKQLLDDKFDGGLDIIVHNAGITRDKTLANMKPEYWDQAFDVNLISLMRLNEELIPVMRKDGRIVCLSSVTGLAGNLGQSNYAASKAGLIGYVKATAPELADKGITMNAVAPGFIETKMTAAMPKGTREVARRLCNLVQGGLPEDVAETVTFLASPGSTGMTGEVLRICGGSYIGA